MKRAEFVAIFTAAGWAKAEALFEWRRYQDMGEAEWIEDARPRLFSAQRAKRLGIDIQWAINNFGPLLNL